MANDPIHTFLAEHPPWDLQDGKLHRVYTFTDFRTAFGFMAACATAAEAMNHHPEWKNVYRTVEVWLTTHDAGRITAKDEALAVEMDRLAGS